MFLVTHIYTVSILDAIALSQSPSPMLRTRRGAVREGYYGLPTLGLTRSYIDAPYVCMDDLRGAARKVEWVPDV